jgi:hypothetical protein
MANAASQDHLENNISRSAHIWVNSVETCLAFNRLSEQTRRLQASGGGTLTSFGRHGLERQMTTIRRMTPKWPTAVQCGVSL